MASTNIRSVSVGSILIQSGNGYPTHLSLKGSFYTDLDTAIQYINKDGLNFWATNIDSTNIDLYLSGATDGNITGGTFDNNTDTLYLNNNTGGTITITGFTDYYTTGATLIGSTAYFDRNDSLSAYTLDLSNLDVNDTFVTGGTPDNLTRSYTFTNNTGGTFTVIGLTDVRITGGTFDNSTDTITFSNNTGGTFNVTGITDTFVTGGTTDDLTRTYTFTNNTGGTFTVIGLTDVRVTGGTTDDLTRSYTFTDNTGGTFNVIGLTDVRVTGGTTDDLTRTYTFTNNTGGTFNVIGLTDVRVTGGTYSGGNATFTNNTGGTFTVTGFTTTDTFVTGFTYSNNNFTIKRNQGQPDLNVLVNNFTGLTINGDFTVTGTTTLNNLIVNSISATTHPLYLTANTVQGQLDNTESSFIRSEKIDKINFKVSYQTGLIRPDTDVSVISNSANTITITAVNNILFINEVSPDTPINKLETFVKSFGNIVFTLNDTNTPTSANTRSVWYLGIDKVGTPVYRDSRVYDQDVCYLIRVLLQNTAGVYTTILTKYYPDLSYNNPLDRGRRILSSGILGWSGSASISFRNEDFTLTKDSVNYSNNKLDPNYLVIPDSSGITPTSFLFILPNVQNVAVPISASTTIDPKVWYTSSGTTGGTNVANSSYQVYNVLETVTGNILIQTLASTSPSPELGVNAIFGTREDALAGLNSVIFPMILPAGDTQQIGTFYLRAGMNPNGSTMNDPTDFYFNPISNSNSSSSVGVTEHDLLSGKNDNPTYQHVEFSSITYWNQIVQQTITDGVTDSSPSQNAVYDALALKANDASVVHKSGDTMTGSLTSPAFITTGGNANQFVKGDGSLDSNVYLTAYTDTYVTGGTPNNLTRTYTFTNNLGGTFNVIGLTDVYITGSSFNNNNLLLNNNTGGTITTFINNFSGLTINGNLNVTGNTTSSTISATTYLNLPTDIRVTGGTFSGGTATFTNNTGGTFNVTGFTSTDIFVTGFTYSNNNLTIQRNQGQPDLNVLVNTMTGLTINGNINVTGDTTTNTISATTYLNLPTDIRVTGGTFDNSTDTITFTNNTGGTFNVTGLTDIFTTAATLINNIVYFNRNDVLSAYTLNLSGVSTSDTYVTGGTPDNLTRTYTFTNNTGGTFNVIGLTDVRVTGGTFDNSTDTITFTNNTGGTFNVTGLTDVFVTGGTTDDLTRSYTFTNNTGGTFNLIGLTDVRITGGTHLNGTTTFTNNTGGTFTVSGYSTGTTSFDVFVTGGTFTNSADTLTFTNNTGGTFNVTGLTDNYTTGATFIDNTIYFNRNDTLSAYTVTITGSSSSTGVIRNEYIYTGGSQTFTTTDNIFSIVSVEVQGGGSLYSSQYSSTTSTFTVLDPLTNGDYIVVMYNINDPVGGSFPIDDFIVDGVTGRAPSQNAVYDAIFWSSSTNTIQNKGGYSALTFNGGASFTSSVKVGVDTNLATSGMVGSIRYREDSNNSYMDMVMKTDVGVYQWVNIVTNSWT